MAERRHKHARLTPWGIKKSPKSSGHEFLELDLKWFSVSCFGFTLLRKVEEEEEEKGNSSRVSSLGIGYKTFTCPEIRGSLQSH